VADETAITDLRKIAEGREAEMFEWSDGKVLRLFRSEQGPAEAARQIDALREAAGAGVPVPRVFGLEMVGGRAGIVMERLDGPDLLNRLGAKPWLVLKYSTACGRVHAQVNRAAAPAALPSNHSRMRRLLADSTPADVPPDYAGAALARLEELSEGDRLCHGDFHPGNVMTRQGEYVVIDWSNAARGVPEADVARTRMMADLGKPPPGTSRVLAFLVRYFRGLFMTFYMREYRKALSIDDRLVEAWALPVAVTRLTEGISEEREDLLRYIEARMLRQTE
jgi:aminoglycoside phosphotransferase (APT) family kinase protein